ncbi:MAG: glycosyltransferase [Akkermansiaceae bacterium]
MSEFQKLRVVHVTEGRSRIDSLHGGDISLYHFTRNLALLGHDVRYVGITHKEPAPIPGVDTVSARRGTIPVMASGELKEKISEFSPDYVHFHGAYVPGNSAGARVARNLEIPYVVTPHGNINQDVLNRRAWLKRPYRRFFELPMLQGARFIHAIADRENIRSYGVTRPIEEARNGIDLPDENAASPGREGLRRFGIPEGKRVALYLGRLDREQKGLDVVVEAFWMARKNNPDLHLVLAGVNWKDDERLLREQIDRLGISEEVTFTGAIYGEEKAELLRDCDLFVHPSRWEAGVPFSVLEAMSYGKPVVVTEEVDREALLAESEAVQVVEGSAPDVAEGIRVLLEKVAGDASSVSSEARGLCEQHFSWRASAELLTQAYLKHLD